MSKGVTRISTVDALSIANLDDMHDQIPVIDRIEDSVTALPDSIAL